MLKRNRFGFRMRRRSISNRLLQSLVVISVLGLFIYLLLFAFTFHKNARPPDYSWLKTRNISHYVLPEESTVIIEPKNVETFCDKSAKLRLLVVVYTAPGNIESRRVIRKTWGKGVTELPGVRLLFLLGISSIPQLQTDLHREHLDNNDIVQHSFIDSYANLTLKTGFMLKWLHTNCLDTKFVFKVDDDVFVNPVQLWNTLEHALLHTTTTKTLQAFMSSATQYSSQQQLQGFPSSPIESESIDYLMTGHAMTSVPIRDVTSKWYLPPKFYPLNIFPRFLSGTGYVMTSSIVPVLYECLLRTPYMNLEDVLLSGLCATTQLGLHLTHNPNFRFKRPFVGPNYVCFFKQSVLVHPLQSSEIEEMWVRIKDDHNCDTFYFGFVKNFNIIIEFFKNLFRL